MALPPTIAPFLTLTCACYARRVQSVNLSPCVRARALRTSVFVFTFALAAAVLLEALGVPRLYRLVLAIPLFAAIHASVSAVCGVCAFSARRGVRNIAGSRERVVDPRERRALRRRGARVLLLSAAVTAAATALLTLSG